MKLRRPDSLAAPLAAFAARYGVNLADVIRSALTRYRRLYHAGETVALDEFRQHATPTTPHTIAIPAGLLAPDPEPLPGEAPRPRIQSPIPRDDLWAIVAWHIATYAPKVNAPAPIPFTPPAVEGADYLIAGRPALVTITGSAGPRRYMVAP